MTKYVMNKQIKNKQAKTFSHIFASIYREDNNMDIENQKSRFSHNLTGLNCTNQN